MLLQGLTLTIVGMSVVFIFLTIMVFVMKTMSAFIPKYFPDATANKQTKVSQTNRETITSQQKSVEIAVEAIPMGEAEIAASTAGIKSFVNTLAP